MYRTVSIPTYLLYEDLIFLKLWNVSGLQQIRRTCGCACTLTATCWGVRTDWLTTPPSTTGSNPTTASSSILWRGAPGATTARKRSTSRTTVRRCAVCSAQPAASPVRPTRWGASVQRSGTQLCSCAVTKGGFVSDPGSIGSVDPVRILARVGNKKTAQKTHLEVASLGSFLKKLAGLVFKNLVLANSNSSRQIVP